MAGVWIATWIGSGCAPSPRIGTVEVLLTDHRVAIGDFTRLTVAIDQVELHPAGLPADSGWVLLSPDVREADLTELTDGATLAILTQLVAAQAYDAVRLRLAGGNGELKEGGEIEFGEFSEIGRVEFDLMDRGHATILIELIVQSQHDHPGLGYLITLGKTELVGGS